MPNWLAVLLVLATASRIGAASTMSAAPAQQAVVPASSPTLDYEFFKMRVQPIFLTKRPGHARCISCHSSGTPLRLQPLPLGRTVWSEEESRKNYDAVLRVVMPGSLKMVL